MLRAECAPTLDMMKLSEMPSEVDLRIGNWGTMTTPFTGPSDSDTWAATMSLIRTQPSGTNAIVTGLAAIGVLAVAYGAYKQVQNCFSKYEAIDDPVEEI